MVEWKGGKNGDAQDGEEGLEVKEKRCSVYTRVHGVRWSELSTTVTRKRYCHLRLLWTFGHG